MTERPPENIMKIDLVQQDEQTSPLARCGVDGHRVHGPMTVL